MGNLHERNCSNTSVLIHCQVDINRTQTRECDSSGTPHNTLVVHYVTIHHQSNLIITFQFLVGSAVIDHVVQCKEATCCGVVPFSNVVVWRVTSCCLSDLTPQSMISYLTLTKYNPRPIPRPPTDPRNSVSASSVRTTGTLLVPCSNPLELTKVPGGAGVQPCAEESLHTSSSTTTTTNVLVAPAI